MGSDRPAGAAADAAVFRNSAPMVGWVLSAAALGAMAVASVVCLVRGTLFDTGFDWILLGIGWAIALFHALATLREPTCVITVQGPFVTAALRYPWKGVERRVAVTAVAVAFHRDRSATGSADDAGSRPGARFRIEMTLPGSERVTIAQGLSYPQFITEWVRLNTVLGNTAAAEATLKQIESVPLMAEFAKRLRAGQA